MAKANDTELIVRIEVKKRSSGFFSIEKEEMPASELPEGLKLNLMYVLMAKGQTLGPSEIRSISPINGCMVYTTEERVDAFVRDLKFKWAEYQSE